MRLLCARACAVCATHEPSCCVCACVVFSSRIRVESLLFFVSCSVFTVLVVLAQPSCRVRWCVRKRRATPGSSLPETTSPRLALCHSHTLT